MIAIETPSEDWHDRIDQMPDTKNSHIRFRTSFFLEVCLQINTKRAQEGTPLARGNKTLDVAEISGRALTSSQPWP